MGDMSINFASDRKFWENFGALRAPANFESNFQKSWQRASRAPRSAKRAGLRGRLRPSAEGGTYTMSCPRLASAAAVALAVAASLSLRGDSILCLPSPDRCHCCHRCPPCHHRMLRARPSPTGCLCVHGPSPARPPLLARPSPASCLCVADAAAVPHGCQHCTFCVQPGSKVCVSCPLEGCLKGCHGHLLVSRRCSHQGSSRPASELPTAARALRGAVCEPLSRSTRSWTRPWRLGACRRSRRSAFEAR